VLPFFHKPGLIEHQHSLGIAQRLDHVGTQLITHGIGVPPRAPQQVLEAIRRRLPTGLRHLPAVLALSRTQQALEVEHHALARLGARKITRQALFEIGQVGQPAPDGVGRVIRRGQRLRCRRFRTV
jgi:hypothetical protein